MKEFALSFFLILPIIAYAQNEKQDTLSTYQLDEVVVQSDRMFMTANKVSYTPTNQQRNASANGTMLLQQLAIPQLSVNGLNGSVTMNTGEPVAFFIDGVPAGGNDIADMNTRDVVRVEILDHPTDPKFRNQAHVVNFIMQKYEYGGYTKINTTEMLMSCFSSYNTLNSKLVYKKMTFDARAYYHYTNSSHYGVDEAQRFLLPGYEDVAPDGVTRSSITNDSKYISNRSSASFRALYEGNNTQLSSTLNWTYDGIPTDRRTGSLQYTPNLFEADSWRREYPLHKNNLSWTNEFFQQLPNDWALSASFQLTYDRISQTQKMAESDIIIRNLTAKENLWGTQSGIELSKSFNTKHNIALGMSANTYESQIDYIGTTINKNNTSQFVVATGGSYTFSPSDRFYSRLGVYATYYRSKMSDVEESKIFPYFNFNLSWMPERRHRIGVSFNYVLNTPSGSQTNAVLLQTDLLKWSQGNPNLRSYHTMTTQLTYTWNPSQYINISPYATWTYNHDYYADAYSLTDDGKGILVKPENCGNNHNIWATLNFTAYAFNRKLILQVCPGMSYHRFTGEFAKSHTGVYARLNATYFMGQYYMGASYSSPQSLYNNADPIKRKTESQYWIMAGWGNSSWTVSAFLINPFRNHWRSDRMMIDTPNYSMSSTAISVNDHRRINLTVAYTFGYGKKVERGNDLQEASGNASSIR